MKSLPAGIFILLLIKVMPFYAQNAANRDSTPLSVFLADYFEGGLHLNPVNATFIGDNRFNDQMIIEFTDDFQNKSRAFYLQHMAKLRQIDPETLSYNERISYNVVKRELQTEYERTFLDNGIIPLDQIYGLPLYLPELGGEDPMQPFNTVEDYENWIKRASAFSEWIDSAIVYFRKGMARKTVLPRILVLKTIPQIEAFITDDPSKSVYYGPIKKMPASFTGADKQRITASFIQLISERIIPYYKKMAAFLKEEYLPVSRSTSGYGALPNGKKMYDFYLRDHTTTDKTAEELFTTGLAEVKRIRGEMEKVKKIMGYRGKLRGFFNYVRTNPAFFPYHKADEVLNAYRDMQKKVEPYLKTMFLHAPQTPFEIRQTPDYRAISSSPQYFEGSPRENRPGIFYVPIVDATKTLIATDYVFLHEAIPGHHYQIMLQQENDSLPKFRRYGGCTAYIEGWALYVESLGKDLGLYQDPYQYMSMLSGEMLRAIRLVVDPGMHAKGWSREKAIKYMMENSPTAEQEVISEVERYMAIPGQAVAYKVGALKIQELREKYKKQLGDAFSLPVFHEELLKDGPLPLDILEQKMDDWARQVMHKSIR